jgi:hypothetical protein
VLSCEPSAHYDGKASLSNAWTFRDPRFRGLRPSLEVALLRASVTSTDADKKYSPQATRKFPLGESITRGTIGLGSKACRRRGSGPKVEDVRTESLEGGWVRACRNRPRTRGVRALTPPSPGLPGEGVLENAGRHSIQIEEPSPFRLLTCSTALLLNSVVSPSRLLSCSPALLLSCSPALLLSCSPVPLLSYSIRLRRIGTGRVSILTLSPFVSNGKRDQGEGSSLPSDRLVQAALSQRTERG